MNALAQTLKAIPSCGPERFQSIPTSRVGKGQTQAERTHWRKIVRRFMRDGKPWHERICKFCGGTFECLAESPREFGHDSCRTDLIKMRQSRGLQIIDLAMEWRGDRSKTEALSKLCMLLGQFRDEDRAVGRPSW